MGFQNHLYRRPSGIYVVRIAVPHRHRARVGRGEVHVSTGLRNHTHATVTALSVVLEWKRRFIALDRMDILKIADGSPLLLGGGYIRLAEAAELLGLTQYVLLQEIANHNGAIYWFTCQRQGYRVDDLSQVDREDGGYVTNSAIDVGEPVTVAGVVKLADSDYVAREITQKGTCLFVHVQLQPHGEHVWFDFEPSPPAIAAGEVLLLKGDVDSIRARYATAIAPDAITAARARAALPRAPDGGKYGAMRVSDLIKAFIKAKSPRWSEEQRQRMPVMLQFFVDLIEDPRLQELDRPMIRQYRDELQRLPRDLRKAKRALPGASGRELIAWADSQKAERMQPQTAGLYVAKLSELLNWATTEQYIPKNVADGLAEHKKRDQRQQDARAIFVDPELSLIFGASWFKTGVGPKSRGGRYHRFQPHYYWLPLLGLYTGGRINELSQLYLDDLMRTADGVPYVHFRLNMPDKLDVDEGDAIGISGSDKRLKTVNAERIVPLHRHLIELGLLTYVDRLRRAGYERLFPELRRDRVKGYGKAASSWFNERYLGNELGIKRDGRKTFHSLRHQFLTALDRIGVQETIVAQLAGHERGETMSATRYRKDQEAGSLKPHVDKVAHAIPMIAEFNTEEGVVAITDAFVRKKQNAKRTPKARPGEEPA